MIKTLTIYLAGALLALPQLRSEVPTLSTPMMPVSEIKPGMQGEWRTTIKGSAVETFRFEVLGTARNFIGPQRDVIIAKALDASQIESGPVGGMSGSPCFIDGKLIGAYAYGYLWPKEQAIIGITPIADMLETFGKENHRQPDKARRGKGAGAPGEEATLRPGNWQVQTGHERLEGLSLESVLQPLPAPLMVAGVSARTLDVFKEEFDKLGVDVMRAPMGFTSELSADSLKTGSPVAGVLITGDFMMAATGTVTWREGDQILAFGHPFFGAGDELMPMAPAEIITVIQSLPRSFKLSNTGPVVGTIYQDRLTAIAGEVGRIPPMTDVNISIKAPGDVERSFGGQLYQNRSWSPLIAAITLLESLFSTMEFADEQTFYTKLTLDIEGFDPLVFDHVATGPEGAMWLAFNLLENYSMLLRNPFEMADVKTLSIEIEAVDEWIYSSLHAIQVRSGELRPGDTLDLAITLNNYLEERTRHAVSIPIPAGTAGEAFTVFVGDAAAADRVDRGGTIRTADSLAGIIDNLRDARTNQRVYVKMLRRAKGMNVNGQRLDELPLSVREMLDSKRSPTPITDTRYVTVWETDFAVPGAFGGEYIINANVQ